MSIDLDPPPSRVALVAEEQPDRIWKTWLYKLYEKIREIVAEEVQKTAFGEQLVASLEPQVQADFSYSVNPDIWHKHQNGGAETVDAHRLKISTGAAANQSSTVFTKAAIKYNPGQGGLVRLTAIFTTGVTNSTQLAGLGDAGDGYFFGYNGADFGVLRRIGGHNEVRTLTVTTKSTTAENITITLDGDADATVAVTDATASDLTQTANEIASHDYSNLGTGWEAHADGDGTVAFVSYDAAAHAGSYTLSGATTAVGTIAAADIVGLAPTDNWTVQADWNVDKRSDLDQTKGNVYQIRYQWLGYGMIKFYIEDNATGDLVLVHKIKYANQNLLPTVNNPTLPICFMVENGSNTSDVIMYSASCMGGSEGKHEGVEHLHHAATVSTASIGTTETPILTIHNPVLFNSVPNRKRPRISSATCSIDGTKPAIVKLTRNGDIIAASYSDIETGASTLKFDTSATAISGGDVKYADGMSKVDRVSFNIDKNFRLYPGDKLSMTVQGVGGTAGATGITGVINVEEEY